MDKSNGKQNHMDLPIIVKRYETLEDKQRGISYDGAPVVGEAYSSLQLEQLIESALNDGLVQEQYQLAYYNSRGRKLSLSRAQKRLNTFLTVVGYASLRDRLKGKIDEGTLLETVNNVKSLKAAIDAGIETLVIPNDGTVACFDEFGKKMTASEAKRFFINLDQ
jgi:hypothetical protein